MTISVTHFTDPGCPWAYSASPALAVLYWRYGDQIDWRLATIGLTEHADQYVRRGYTPARGASPPPHSWSPRACTGPSASTRCSARCSSRG
jgi:hypothetical protein